MWRVLVYLLLIGIAAWGAVWLANHPETASVTWSGREYTVPLSVGAIAVVGAALAISLVGALIGWIARLPRTIGKNNRDRRRGRGLQALSRGKVAVGSGDVAAARRYAGEAERLLGPEPLALLLRAQAAQAAGNRDAAETAFRRMTQVPDTRVLGLRGLYLEALRRGERVEARNHATDAARLAPAAGWANEAVIEGYVADRDWQAALRNVERRASLGLVDRATSRRQRAVLHAATALDGDGLQPDRALAAAQEAVRLAPDLAPAAALAGRLLAERGDLRRAAKILETAWRGEQHPDVAAAYLNLRAGDAAADRIARAETLAKLSSWSPESRLALARAAIDGRDLPRARQALQPLADDRPTVRFCFLMAELEQADGNEGRVREWLGRATHAAPDKAWVADGVVSESWAPVSPVTGQLDAFRWEVPPETVSGGAHRLDFLRTAPEPEGTAGPMLPPASPADVAPPESAPADETPPSGPRVVEALPETVAAAPASSPTPDNAAPVHREPESVVFPVAQAPDDPGAEREPRKAFRLMG